MTQQQYADDPVAKSGKVADGYDLEKMNEIFIEGVDVSLRHSLPHY